LLHALNQYLINIRTAEAAKKHIPTNKLVRLETMDFADAPQAMSDLSPEDTYNYAWLSALLDQILSEVEAKCCREGMEIHWNIFHDRVVQSILENVEPLSLADICEKYGIEDEKKASNMNITVKRRFQAALKQHISNTVTSEDHVNEEFEEIMQFFSKSAQHFK
jgi:hypothetical protein